MSVSAVGNSTASANGLLAQRSEPGPSKKQARRALWRTLKLVYPHRRTMILGMVLGLGVALTYAGTLGGILPVLKVITASGEQSLHDWLVSAAEARGVVSIPFEFEGLPDLDWQDSADDDYSPVVTLPFSVTLGGETFVAFVQDSNGYVELLHEGESAYAAGYGSVSDLTGDGDPTHTFLMAAYDDLDSEYYGYYGHKLEADRIIFHWLTETYDDAEYGYLNEFQMTLHDDGRVQWNFNFGAYYDYGYDLFTGLYLGYDSQTLTEVIIGDIPEEESWQYTEAAEHWYAPWLKPIAALFPAGTTPADQMRTLLTLLGGLVGLNLVGNLLRCLSQYLILNASNRMMMDLRRKMYRKALRVPMTDLAGDVSNRVSQFMSDTREIFIGVTTLFGKVAREPLKAICVLIVALSLDARLTLVVVAISPVAVILLWYFGRKVRKATVRLLEGYGVMLGGLEETLQGADVVKGYGREGYERKRMWRIERRMLKQLLRLAWIEALASPLIEVVGVVATCCGIVWLGARTFRGEIDPAHFMTMVALLAAMLDPVRKIANVYNMVQRAGAASTRVFDFLDQPEEHSPPNAKQLPADGPRAVSFEGLTFRYTPTQEPPALHEVSLKVEPGECIAIVGPNGSGKSTLVKMLPRLLEPQVGRVLIDGLDVRELSLRSLRMQIAVVSQRPVIFARSVLDNIAYGKAGASLDEVKEAARHAYAAEFIEQWPQQYDTQLGEFGTSVSGGQRQRIAIARAFLKPASIVIFDEATSEVDAESERKIHAALNELRQGKTTFLIAHRHTVMDMAERIVVMDAGRIVDVGPHAELIERCPLYVALYRSPAIA